jgi:primosomal protein N' (replication factor Y)
MVIRRWFSPDSSHRLSSGQKEPEMPAASLTISSENPYVEVALPIPVRKNFTYRLPRGFAASVKIGARVLVPFGKRTLTGYAIAFPTELQQSLELDESVIKDVIELVDEEPLLTDEILRLTEWAADYYAASWGEMLKASLPAGINAAVEQIVSITAKGKNVAAEGEQKTLKWKVLARLVGVGETPLRDLANEFGEASVKRAVRELASAELASTRQRTLTSKVKAKLRKAVRLLSVDYADKPLTDQQKTIIDMLSSNGGEMLFTDLLEKSNVGASPVNTLAKRGLVEVYVQEVLRDPLLNAPLPDPNDLTLNAGQSFVFSEIKNALGINSYQAFLLHGVTGSGKTEVYIRAMRSALERDKSALMLVPEIALTPIFSRRLRSVFGDNVAILHSNLSPGERFDEWRRIRSGAARIAIGTRSAIFAPLHDLGLLIIDEEHDTSYRQHESPFYNARDVAVMRANLAGAVVVLGSATPSLESFHNAKTDKYQYLQLQNRIGNRPMAKAELIDMRAVFKRFGKDIVLSPELLDSIAETHSKGEQSIILLNRRGFSSFVLCRSCGETLRCKNCDITLTYHKRDGRIVCHYCNYATATPKVCPFCESEYLYFVGEGTEQLEDLLNKKFPDLKKARIDRDTMKRRGEMDKTLLAFDRGEIDMLVGTQMLAKGHDFHNVTLVGVISVDIGLGLPDFRSAERTFQLLTQVAGRAGRGNLPGRVLIQTYYPEHYALKYAVEQNYENFYDHEIRFRERMSYPPFVVLASILIKHSDLAHAQKNARILKTALDRANTDSACRILGPASASIARLKNEYRLQIILKSHSRKSLRVIIENALKEAEVSGGELRTFTIEIDPVNLM